MAHIITDLVHSGDVKEKVKDQLDQVMLLWNDNLMPKLWKTSTDLTPVKKRDLILLPFPTNPMRIEKIREAERVHRWNQDLPFKDHGGRH